MTRIVYYSSHSQNTHRFVERLGIPACRIPVSPQDGVPQAAEPYVLITPTYADDAGKGAVPKQVVRFLNDPQNRELLQGVIAAGNRNFGQFYAYAGPVIAQKCNVPLLYRFELSGTEEDINNVQQGIEKLWQSLNLTTLSREKNL